MKVGCAICDDNFSARGCTDPQPVTDCDQERAKLAEKDALWSKKNARATSCEERMTIWKDQEDGE